MNKRNLFFVLTILFILSLLNLTAQTDKEGTVNVKSASVYSKPDAKSKVLRSLSKNTSVKILDEKGDFYNVEVKGNTGWVKKANIKTVTVTKIKPSENKTSPPEDKSSKSKTVTSPPTEKNEKKKENEKEKNDVSSRNVKTSSITEKSSENKWGINLGGSIASLSGGDAPSGIGSRAGLTAGAFYQGSFMENSDLFSWRVELRYNQKGGTVGDTTYRMDYIELPLLVCLVFNSGEINPFLTVGPTIAYNLNAGMKAKETIYKIDDINKLDVNLSVGLGVNYKIDNNMSIGLDVRYLSGLMTIHDKSVHNAVKELEIKNNSILVMLGVMF
jgi:opacity protein-like surface antigen